jgi:crotonobetainyl-CoA:carnitine CoA-transferase CaiB-like acyl-CoA transferase
VFDDPHVQHRQMVVEVDDAAGGRVRQVGMGVKLSETPGRIRHVGPRIGQHTSEVMRTLGYAQAEIEALQQQHVIG